MISVIIATRNRSALLERTLRALNQQACAPHTAEVIVADNGSTDGTREVVESFMSDRFSSVKYLPVARLGKSHAINAALLAAAGEVIAFTDDDVQPDRRWLATLTRAFAEDDYDFIAGRIFPLWECPPPRWLSQALHGVVAVNDNGDVRHRLALGQNTHIMPIGANMAVRARVFRKLGGLRTDLGKLDGTFRTGEDHEFYLRLLHAGCLGLYEPNAVVLHFVPASRLNKGYFRRWLYQNGQDVARLERLYPDAAPRLLSVPRYLWRSTSRELRRWVAAVMRGDAASSFAALTRVAWFCGYVREMWFGSKRIAPVSTCENKSRSSLRISA